ncbi:acyl-CoA dehydrogenase family protein [Streptomyces sp. NPDC058657]|uniref:acyl-CoA dehydrogenase family protein n=1 Tax=unclassified Streptomyces TaxID=2593676 RepID=UPI0036514323
MDFAFGTDDSAFRGEVREWLDAALVPFADALGAGGPGREHEAMAARRDWERELGAAGWIGLGWDSPPYARRQATLVQQVIWAEEYARSRAPARIGHIGENLLAPTLLAYGTEAQRRRFLPGIARGEELWCQGYSEPGAGSDLAAVRTAAVRDGEGHRVTGQKVWTSLAHEADWCFVLARTEAGSARQRGLSFLLVPMRQEGVEVRPIRQMSGTAEFNEVFFDGAYAGEVVGGEGRGWAVATSLLGLERGVSTLAQQVGFEQELADVLAVGTDDPVLRDALVRQWSELRVMRWNAMRTLGTSAADDPGAPSVAKLLWGSWHQRLGELAMRVRGAEATVAGGTGPAAGTGGAGSAPGTGGSAGVAGAGDSAVAVGAVGGVVAWDPSYPLDRTQRLFLFSRADTLYGGSDEIQRNIIAERVLGLPREARGSR